MVTRKVIITEIKKLQLAFASHIMIQKGIKLDILAVNVMVKKNRGRRRNTLLTNIRKVSKVNNFQNLMRTTQNRDLWSFMVAEVCSRYGT